MNVKMIRMLPALFAVAAMVCATLGCRTSEHRSYRRYDSTNEPSAKRQTEPKSGEYEMVSPGEMESEGEMVSPGQMIEE